MARTLVAAIVAALAVTAAWLSLEEPRRIGEALAIAALAIAPALVPSGRVRLLTLAPATLAASWVAFGAQPWELLPFRDERVLAPMLRDVGTGVVDFYGVFLPFVPVRNPEMHSLVLCAVFGFTLAVALLVAARRPMAASAVVVAGVGWPATLSGGSAIAFGTAALVAGLAIPLVLRASSLRTLAAGSAIAALVVVGAASASSVTTLGRDAALDWESWDLRGPAQEASAVRFVWDSNYSGITFPPTKTVVLRVEGPDRCRTTGGRRRSISCPTTTGARISSGSIRSTARSVRCSCRSSCRRGLRSPRTGSSRPSRSRRSSTTTSPQPGRRSGSMRAASEPSSSSREASCGSAIPCGPVSATGCGATRRTRLRVRSRRRLPGHPLPPPASSRWTDASSLLSRPHSASVRCSAFLRDPSYLGYGWHRTLYEVAHRVAGKATTQYGAVLALESWFRQTGGFRYDESPPRTSGPPLVAFVTRTKAGYCQHFAGAMALMLRLLGIPARVAVGFTSGTRDGDAWVVTDHDAHAWVEVWFAGQGWVPFDPTPGRGTLGGDYTFASGSQAAVAALRRGQLSGKVPARPTRLPDVERPGRRPPRRPIAHRGSWASGSPWR